MKNTILITICLMLGTALVTPTFAQTFRVTTADAAILGSSNVHDWESDVTRVFLQGDFTFADGQLENIQNLSVRIPVENIESEKGRIMDNKTYEALKSEEHPNIRFSMTSLRGITQNGNVATINVRGNLTVAGATRTVDLTATATRLANGQLRIEGSKDLLMTNFGIEPPTALLGTMTVADEITFRYSLTLGAVDSSASN
ncbi:MAG: YceI family protein [Lewinella sp.]|nr:YceI family protein [Lewinella sp.]